MCIPDSRYWISNSLSAEQGFRIPNVLEGIQIRNPGFRIPLAKNVLDYGMGIVTLHELMQTPSCEEIAGPKSRSELSKEAQQLSLS